MDTAMACRLEETNYTCLVLPRHGPRTETPPCIDGRFDAVASRRFGVLRV